MTGTASLRGRARLPDAEGVAERDGVRLAWAQYRVNVPGPAERRYYDGSLLEALYPLSLVLHGQVLNITAVSNADTFCIGFTGGRDTVPHLQRIAVSCADLAAARRDRPGYRCARGGAGSMMD